MSLYTALGNSLEFREKDGAPPEHLLRFLHRLSPGAPVFNRTGLGGVTIQLRLGDPAGARFAGAFTRSYRSINLVTTVSSRNNPD